MDCPKCKATNPDGKRFCGDCGSSLDSIDEEFRRNVQAVIREQLRDQKMVEIETADAVLQRLKTWAKPLLYSVAVVAAVLGLLGFRTLRDTIEALKTAREQALATLQEQAKHESRSIAETADAIRADYRKLGDQQDLVQKLKQAEDRVASIEVAGKKLKARFELASTELAKQDSAGGRPSTISTNIGMSLRNNGEARSTNRYFVEGSSGPEVERIQQRLRELACFNGELSGAFDAATKAAVERFNSARGDPLATGVVDPATWEALFAGKASRCR